MQRYCWEPWQMICYTLPCLQKCLVVIWLLLRLNTILLACQNVEIDIAPSFVRKAKWWIMIIKVKARAFVEMVSQVEAAIEDEMYMFEVKELHCLYQNSWKNSVMMLKPIKANFKNPFLIILRALAYKNSQMERIQYIFFLKALNHCWRMHLIYVITRKKHCYLQEQSKYAGISCLIRKTHHLKASFQVCKQLLTTSFNYKAAHIHDPIWPDLNTAVRETQVCNTVSQILMYNARKQKQKEDSVSSQHSLRREPPVPHYVGLNIDTLNRNKGIIDRFVKLGISVLYDWVLQVERILAQNLCKQFREENIICPPSLRKWLYTVAAIDNIDHNPSSTTATGSLHGTATSIMQHWTMENPSEKREIQFHKGPFVNEFFLPDDLPLSQLWV